MSRPALQPHHLKNLPNPIAEALTALLKMRLQDDVCQHASLEIIRGKPLDIALAGARKQVKRDNRPTGWVSLDAESRLGCYSLAETIAAADPADVLDNIIQQQSRWVEFEDGVEKGLKALGKGTRSAAAGTGLSQRRHQQINKAQINKAQTETAFAAGGSGQGALFGWEKNHA